MCNLITYSLFASLNVICETHKQARYNWPFKMSKDMFSLDDAKIDLHLAVLNDPRKDSVEIDSM